MPLEIDFFVDSLSGESKEVRMEAEFVFDVLRDTCERALSKPEKLPGNYFSKRAMDVYRQAEKQSQQDALRVGYLALFEYCSKSNDALVAPAFFVSLTREITHFNDDAPPLNLNDAINTIVLQILDRSEVTSERLVALALMLASHTGIRKVDQLKAILSSKLPDLRLFTDSSFALCCTSQGRFMFDAVALRAFTMIQSLKFSQADVDGISNHFDRVFQAHTLIIEGYYRKVKVNDALEAMSLCRRPLSSSKFDDIYQPLDDENFIRAVSGHTPKNLNDTQPSKKTNKRTKRLSSEFLTLTTLTELFKNPKERNFAYDARTISADSELLYLIRKELSDFAAADPKQHRNSRAFHTLKANLLKLLSTAYADVSGISFTVCAISTYIIDLALHGSTFKSRLAMSTIESYLSTISNFANDAWTDDALMRDAQDSDDALDELTEIVSTALGDVPDVDKQGTVINFLKYLSQTTELKFYEPEALDYYGGGVAKTRSHYISYQDLTDTCNLFLAKSNIVARRNYVLCIKLLYALGIRRQEAALLEVNDIRFDLGFVYVTRVTRRKSQRAIRRLPIALLPKALEDELSHALNERKQLGYTTLFDESMISRLNKEFTNLLRAQCRNDALVLHSLRHSAANNLVLQFSMCSRSENRKFRKKFFFLQGEIFEDKHLERLTSDLIRTGRKPGFYFPTLDTVAQLLGHVSPTVTAASYLHLLDIVNYIQHSHRTSFIDEEIVVTLLPKNNYRFELKKRYRELKQNVIDSHDFLFRVFSRSLRDVQLCSMNKNHKRISIEDEFTFNHYLTALKTFKQSPGVFGNKALLDHFENLTKPLSIDFMETKACSSNSSAWLCLLEIISNTQWNQINTIAIRTLSEMLNQTEITNLRTAERYCRALSIISLRGIEIALCAPNCSDPRIEVWRLRLERFDVKVILKTRRTGNHLSILTKPEALRWPLWHVLPQIIEALLRFIDFTRATTDPLDTE